MSWDWGTGVMGLAVGFLVGLTGVGGAALLTPVLVLIGIHPSVAVGTDLLYNSITKLFGMFQHARQRTVHWRLVGHFAMGSIPGAAVAILTLKLFNAYVHSQESLIKHALGAVLVVVALVTLAKPLLDRKFERLEAFQDRPVERKKALTVSIGFALGFVVGLTSVGSGSLFALALIYLYRLKGSQIVGTDIAHAFFLVTAAALMHAEMGNVDYGLTLNLLAGSIPGVLAGSAVSARVPTGPLRAVVASIILLSGIKLLG